MKDQQLTTVSIPLWRQLQATARALAEVRAGRSLTAVIERVERELRPGVQALSFQVMRTLGRAEALRRQLARRPPPGPVDALLCTALALVWCRDTAPYEAFTLVDQAVEAAKRSPDTRAQASFVNACLRRFLRERDQLVELTNQDPVARWNYPRWWIDRLRQEYPEHWEEILRASDRPAPMALRVNARHATAEQYLQTLQAAGIKAVAQGTAGVLLERPQPVQEIPGFMLGVVSVQDAGAQQAAQLLLGGLDTSAPLNILDACAAPGGKTAHLLEASAARVTALDIDAQRCERITQNLQRLGLRANVVVADAAEPARWWDGELFDAILLDAPCTASGIVRRHPDVRWLRREADISQLAAQQARLLKALWPLLKPGGRLLYCTCSVFHQEGRDQIKSFVANNMSAIPRPAPGHLIPQGRGAGDSVPDNQLGDHDGFFYALLEKRPA